MYITGLFKYKSRKMGISQACELAGPFLHLIQTQTVAVPLLRAHVPAHYATHRGR
jgi:hypothetical protein